MIIYRAMSKEEKDRTILFNRPDFKKRFKWFSQNLTFLLERVRDGKFNNSKHIPGRYAHVLMFYWDEKKSDFQFYFLFNEPN